MWQYHLLFSKGIFWLYSFPTFSGYCRLLFGKICRFLWHTVQRSQFYVQNSLRVTSWAGWVSFHSHGFLFPHFPLWQLKPTNTDSETALLFVWWLVNNYALKQLSGSRLVIRESVDFSVGIVDTQNTTRKFKAKNRYMKWYLKTI